MIEHHFVIEAGPGFRKGEVAGVVKDMAFTRGVEVGIEENGGFFFGSTLQVTLHGSHPQLEELIRALSAWLRAFQA